MKTTIPHKTILDAYIRESINNDSMLRMYVSRYDVKGDGKTVTCLFYTDEWTYKACRLVVNESLATMLGVKPTKDVMVLRTEAPYAECQFQYTVTL